MMCKFRICCVPSFSALRSCFFGYLGNGFTMTGGKHFKPTDYLLGKGGCGGCGLTKEILCVFTISNKGDISLFFFRAG